MPAKPLKPAQKEVSDAVVEMAVIVKSVRVEAPFLEVSLRQFNDCELVRVKSLNSPEIIKTVGHDSQRSEYDACDYEQYQPPECRQDDRTHPSLPIRCG